MKIHSLLAYSLLPLFLYSCRVTHPLEPIIHEEHPFVQLKTGKKIDTTLSTGNGDESYMDIRRGSAKSFGGVKNIAVYGDGAQRWGNVGNRFYPLVMTGKLDVYQTYHWESTDMPNSHVSIAHKVYGYSFAKAGSADIKKANYSNLKPYVANNPALRSELQGFNIINKTTIVTGVAGFGGFIAGGVLLYKAALGTQDGNNNGAAFGTAAGVLAGSMAMYVASRFINRNNHRKIQDVLRKIDRAR